MASRVWSDLEPDLQDSNGAWPLLGLLLHAQLIGYAEMVPLYEAESVTLVIVPRIPEFEPQSHYIYHRR